jgi:hypothetical protein
VAGSFSTTPSLLDLIITDEEEKIPPKAVTPPRMQVQLNRPAADARAAQPRKITAQIRPESAKLVAQAAPPLKVALPAPARPASPAGTWPQQTKPATPAKAVPQQARTASPAKGAASPPAAPAPPAAKPEAPPRSDPPVTKSVPLPDMPGESLDADVMPFLPGIILALRDALGDALKGKVAGNLRLIQEASNRMAGKAEYFHLDRLSKISRCVERAAEHNDLEVAGGLLDDLTTITQAYIASLQQCSKNFMENGY